MQIEIGRTYDIFTTPVRVICIEKRKSLVDEKTNVYILWDINNNGLYYWYDYLTIFSLITLIPEKKPLTAEELDTIKLLYLK